MPRRDRKSRKERGTDKKVGGFAFFLSLFFLSALGSFNLLLIPALIDTQALLNWLYFAGGCLLGCGLAVLFITGHYSVFLHELRHSILSNLVGNKAKSMKVRKSSGHFEYQYTKATAEYNAFISLAPYFLPVFTVAGLIIGFATCYSNHKLVVLIAATGYGIDLVLNMRDISPYQTDLSLISGGYRIGLAYVIAINLTLFSIFAAWISQGPVGLKYLVYGLWRFMLQIVAYYRGGGIS